MMYLPLTKGFYLNVNVLRRDNPTGLDVRGDILYWVGTQRDFLMGKRHENGRLGREKADIPDLTRLHSRGKPSLSV